MLIWTIITTSISDPGEVPLYWGFYIDDQDNKRRRYCLMCNVFKPERCHHCSMCNRCVLNMDHHCPWINNCIGFYNRKFFIQMLFYMNMVLLFIVISNAKITFDKMSKILTNRVNLKYELGQNLGHIFMYIIDLGATIVITLFFKFHLTLVFQNKTTLESMDKNGINFESIVILLIMTISIKEVIIKIGPK
jgi:palmitoyltransferase